MRKPGLRGALWPNELEEQLLGAALFDESHALDCWLEATTLANTEGLVEAAGRLGPLLYRKLSSLGVDGPAMPRLESLYRRSLFANQLQLDGLQEILALFAEAGVETLVLKGAALIASYYQDAGVRPMNDADVLVPWAMVEAALKSLERAGWVRSPIPVERLLRNKLVIEFRDSRGHVCDLHWQTLPDFVLADRPFAYVDALWKVSRQISIGDVSARAMGASDQLLYAILCGHYSEGRGQWVADAMNILKHEPNLDWARVSEHATRSGLGREVGDALDYLGRFLRAPIPDHVVENLKTVRPTRCDAILHWATTRRERPGQAFLYSVRGYVRTNGGRGFVRVALGFPRFLQDRYELVRLRQLPAAITRRMVTKAGQRLS